MPVKIGIPRSLLYYKYFPLWKTFFEGLGAEVEVSGPTTKAVVQEGVKLCVDEACLPVKVAFGHVASLKEKVDYIFIPRLVSVSPREYICPKFLGFPDMVRNSVHGLPGIIDTNINLYRREGDLYGQFLEAASPICRNPLKVAAALRSAVGELKRFNGRVESGMLPENAFRVQEEKFPFQAENRGTVALVGHPYNIYDNYINMNLIGRLDEARVRVVTADNVPEPVVNMYAGTLSKRLFWTLGRRMVGAAYHFLDNPRIDGIIHVASFACGPDSMTGDLIERRARRAGNKPFLNLTLDEHTGEAGVVTRIEAFLDMIDMKMGVDAGVGDWGLELGVGTQNTELRTQNSELRI
ncbi:MAG: acyl-CoA dehydratase activase-related protein [Peptococcaceae bacterium]|nr:acyl-CoA dehydratase activase-related protein [Peptococcaceae bacterium]